MPLNVDEIERVSKAPLLSDVDRQVQAHFLEKAAPLLTYSAASVVDGRLSSSEPLTAEHRATLLDALATLSPVEYELRREKAATKIGVSVKAIEKEMKARHRTPLRPADTEPALFLADTDPADYLVEGAELFKKIVTILKRFMVLGESCAETVTLWIFQAHCAEAFGLTPRLAIQSPTKGCGKTTLLEIVAELVPRALPLANVTAATLFRTIETHSPTMLLDEADTFMPDNEDLRGIVNSGYRRKTATVARLVGDNHEPKKFCTYAPMVIASIGELPDTVQDRSIVIALKRKTPAETVEDIQWQSRKGKALEAELHTLNRELARWAKDQVEAVRDTEPVIPAGLFNRKADNWMSLLAIAEVIGGPVVEKARTAALTLSAVEPINQSKEIELLRDLQEIVDKEKSSDAWPSQALCDKLVALEERPWAKWKKGQPLDPPLLARYLRPFGVTSKGVRHGENNLKSYVREQLNDAFKRYLSTPSPETPPSSRYSATLSHQSGENPLLGPATEAACSGTEKRTNPAPRAECSGVAAANPEITLWSETVDALEVFDDA